MASLNQVTLIGNLTRDVEIRQIGSGTSVAEVGLAVNHRVKKGEEWVDEPCFVDVTVWGKTAEYAAEKLGKGSTVCVEGRLKLDSWEQDGQKRSKLKVVAERLQGLSAPKQGGATSVKVSQPVQASLPVEDDSNVPF
jgi:single-strand DNA-binding protein